MMAAKLSTLFLVLAAMALVGCAGGQTYVGGDGGAHAETR